MTVLATDPAALPGIIVAAGLVLAVVTTAALLRALAGRGRRRR